MLYVSYLLAAIYIRDIYLLSNCGKKSNHVILQPDCAALYILDNWNCIYVQPIYYNTYILW